MASRQHYKKYSFEHRGNIMFFDYNHDHPLMMKSSRFVLGNVRIYTPTREVYSSQITSNPHLSPTQDWN